MKKIFLLFTLSIILTACHTPTPQEKGEKLVVEYITKHLNYPESFELIECQVDTAFYPAEAPETMELILKFSDLFEDLKYAKRELDRREEMYELNRSARIRDSFFEYETKKAKQAYEEAQKKYDKLESKGQKMLEKFVELKEMGKTPNGWKSIAKYKAKNNGGEVLSYVMLFFMDKDFTKVTATYDENDMMKLFAISEEMQELSGDFMDE